MEKRYGEDIIKEKLIIDANTGKPVKEIVVSGDNLKVIKENGETVEFPLNSIRGKFILTRLETGISEFTEPIYV